MENYDTFSDRFGAFLEANQTWIIIVAAAVLAAGAIVLLMLRRKHRDAHGSWTIRELSTAAMCLALGFLLSFIKVWTMPQGGSITPASMLPVMLFAYIYGTPKGLIVGFAYALLQCLQDFYVVHWAQFLLDYIVAFTLLGLAGLIKKSILPGMAIAGVLRFVAHTVSGVVFFAEYAGIGQNVWAYSLGYNSFALIDLAICLVITALPPVHRMIRDMRSRLGRKPLAAA
jgi:thiamine transporter